MQCQATLNSGRPCNNQAKYGIYCGIHREKTTSTSLFELPTDILDKIYEFADLEDLIRLSKTCCKSNYYVANYFQEHFYELFDIEKLVLRNRTHLTRSVQEALFIMCGGGYKSYKIKNNAFYVDNKEIMISISRSYVKAFLITITTRCSKIDKKTSTIIKNMPLMITNENLEKVETLLKSHRIEDELVRELFFLEVDDDRLETLKKNITGYKEYVQKGIHVNTNTFVSQNPKDLERFFWKTVLAKQKCELCN